MPSSHRPILLRASATLVLVLAADACSLALKAEDAQCQSDSDCEARGFQGAVCNAGICAAAPADPKWGCVGNIQWASPDPSLKLTQVSEFRRLVGEVPIADMTVRLCSRLDVDCKSPVDSSTTDATGQVTLSLFKGFDGFMRAEPPVSFPEMMPAIIVALPPPTESTTSVDEPLHLTSSNEMNAIAAIVGKALTPGMGHIFGLAVDCQGNPTSGVVLKLDTVSPETLAYYINASGLPSATQGESGPNGEAGFINVPVGYATVTATSVERGKISSVSVPVLADHITYVPLPPSP